MMPDAQQISMSSINVLLAVAGDRREEVRTLFMSAALFAKLAGDSLQNYRADRFGEMLIYADVVQAFGRTVCITDTLPEGVVVGAEHTLPKRCRVIAGLFANPLVEAASHRPQPSKSDEQIARDAAAKIFPDRWSKLALRKCRELRVSSATDAILAAITDAKAAQGEVMEQLAEDLRTVRTIANTPPQSVADKSIAEIAGHALAAYEQLTQPRDEASV